MYAFETIVFNVSSSGTLCNLQTHSTITVQKDVRKLRQKSNKDGTTTEDCDAHKEDHGPKNKAKTPRTKKKADAALIEKRKR